MVAGIFCLSAMDAGMRYLVVEGFSAVQLIALRGWVVLAVMSAWLLKRAGVGALATRRPLAHALRAVLGMISPLAFFVALKTVPLADATAVFFSSVFILTIGSVLFFGEHVGAVRWLAVFSGFTGVLIVTRPGSAGFQPQMVLVLVASAFYCVLVLMGRWLSRTESTFSLVFWYNVASTLSYSALLPWFWQPFDASAALVLLMVSALALAGHFLLVGAFSIAPVSAVAPFEYTALAWATAFGFIVWGEVPSTSTFAGIVVIIVAGLVLAWGEGRARR